MAMFEKIKETEDRYHELETLLGLPKILQDQKRYRKYAKEHSVLTPIITVLHKHQALQDEISENRSLLEDPDPEMKKLAREEIEALNANLANTEDELKLLLLPKDPNDEKNTLLEIRAGTGGDEAALFAADLFRMYSRYAELRRWKTDGTLQTTNCMPGVPILV